MELSFSIENYVTMEKMALWTKVWLNGDNYGTVLEIMYLRYTKKKKKNITEY